MAALQLGSKRNPELQDKFVLCQVPCYTEDEESLRRTVDSLAALNYDDKRKLLFIICDDHVIESRTMFRIVLDTLGYDPKLDPKLDPKSLMTKSVGEGLKALNYGKVHLGYMNLKGSFCRKLFRLSDRKHLLIIHLYHSSMVTVKVGKPTERSEPGNRGKRDGKRDSQILPGPVDNSRTHAYRTVFQCAIYVECVRQNGGAATY